ncbi:MAG: threonine--tRNA ligase, partial [Gammaproteobacteria bacterium]|nr:threonine--tRNA ligase [Gammaproteobacteria bacterium]
SGHNFTPEDLENIEKRMLEIAADDLTVERIVSPREKAIEIFRNMGEHYKVQIIEDLPGDEEITIYKQGEWMDLCRGPHVPSTGKLQAFKLTKVAGAYWRGDANNQQLQRIYGTAWANKKQLKAYLTRIEEAEKRDHRKIAKKLNLFHTQEEAPGMVFWHPAGWSIYQTIERYMRDKQMAYDYREIKTPQVVDLSLWQRSGHADKFAEGMFTLEAEDRQFAVKPMNCPCHVQVFNQGLKSYRDLPLRLAEFGSCHRNEPSGSLHGIMRVRGFTQDDAHIFCTEAQIQPEVSRFIDMLHEVYADFGFSEVIYRLSTRPPERVGSDEDWDRAEAALAEALDAKGLPWETLPGEGAFYGPKIEFSLKDCIGRVWQLGTIQVDFSMPGRLDAQYVAEDGARKTPVMLHRAVLGS